MGCGASSANAVEQVNAPDRPNGSEVGVVSESKPVHKQSVPSKSIAATKEDSELEMLSTKTHSMSAALASGAHTGSLHDNYVLGKTLGTGGYAQVKCGVHIATQKKVAIKIMTFSEPTRRISIQRNVNPGASTARASMDQKRENIEAHAKAADELKYIIREIEVLKGLDHPAIMKLFEYYLSPNAVRIYLVLELLPGGELLTALQKRGVYTEGDARKAFVQVLKGLEYLHKKGIIHRDLKLENLLLLDEEDLSTVKIADFGLAKSMHERRTGVNPELKQTMCGTPMYMAPEIVKRQGYTAAVDLWSAGVILFTLLTGTMPFHNKNQQLLFKQITDGRFNMNGKRWATVSEQGKALVQALLTVDHEKRPTATEALNHEWVLMSDVTLDSPLAMAQQKMRQYAQYLALPVRLYRDGEMLICQGQRCPNVFLIRKGVVEVFVEDKFCGPDGPVSVIPLGQCIDGEYIGEFSLFSESMIRTSFDVTRKMGEAVKAEKLQTLDGEVPPCPIGVRAVGDVEVVVYTRQQLKDILDHDKVMDAAVAREAEERILLLERKWRHALENTVCPLPKKKGSTASAHDNAASMHMSGATHKAQNGAVSLGLSSQSGDYSTGITGAPGADTSIAGSAANGNGNGGGGDWQPIDMTKLAVGQASEKAPEPAGNGAKVPEAQAAPAAAA